MTTTTFRLLPVFLTLAPLWAACDGAPDAADSPSESVPETYSFESRYQEGISSVSYSGQTLRHVLINDLTHYIGSLDGQIETEADFDPSRVEANLLAYYEFDSDTLGQNPLLISSEPQLLQEVYDDVASGKDLAGKVAGNDDGGAHDHKDWSTQFRGWSDASIATNGGSIESPDGLLRAFFATLGQNAAEQVNGDDNRKLLKVHQTASGQDLEQLVQKFLLGAITFAQASDDYLDEELSADNQSADEDNPYSALEHAWDEGFGYFGAARDYLEQSKEGIAAGEQHDTNEDGAIDLLSEYNFGASVNAAKRDIGAQTQTNLVETAMTAFLTGRSLIASGAGADQVKEQADRAISAWEAAMAATAIHYINELLVDQTNMGGDEYSFDDHAKHWSELKGFALAFQFNPASPLSDSDFVKFHELIGDAPVLSDAEESALSTYADALDEARTLLKDAHNFTADDVETW
jgi:hypothetical protein